MKYDLGGFSTEVVITNFEKLDEIFTKDTFLIIDKKLLHLYPGFTSQTDKIFLFDATEENKSLAQASSIINWLVRNRANRHSYIIAAGGGITTDLAGWVACNYMRGCHLYLIPTTLIGMIDAAIAGKTGINYYGAKNLLGSFYPAEKVLIIIEFLKSLPQKHFFAGLAELIKIALLQNGSILGKLNNKNKKTWQDSIEEFILSALHYKMMICSADLKDTGNRRLLNLGHTFAHIIESASKFDIEHGRAVAIGIFKAAELSFLLNLISEERKEYIIYLLHKFLPDDYLVIDPATIDMIKIKGEDLLRHDKKSGKYANLILFSGDNDFIIKKNVDWLLIRDILLKVVSYKEET
jgi:3-dehydroquinate synthase